MTIQTVALSNTFNQFRETTNLVIGEVNKLSDGTGNLVIDTITANTFTGVVTDLDISGNTGTDVITLGTDTLSFVGTNNISTVVTANTVRITLNQSSSNTANTTVSRDTGGSAAFNVVTAASYAGAGVSSSNGASTVVQRDASGDFSANNVTAQRFIGEGTRHFQLVGPDAVAGKVVSLNANGTITLIDEVYATQAYANSALPSMSTTSSNFEPALGDLIYIPEIQRVVISYQQVTTNYTQVAVGIIHTSNSNITFGTPVVINSQNLYKGDKLDWAIQPNRLVVSYRNNNVDSTVSTKIGYIGGPDNTEIVLGSETVVGPGGSNGSLPTSYYDFISAVYSNTHNRYIIGYTKDESTGTPDLYSFRVGFIDATSNTITYGTSNTEIDATVIGSARLVFDESANRLLGVFQISYDASVDRGLMFAKVGFINATANTTTWGANAIFSANTMSSGSATRQFAVGYNPNENKTYVINSQYTARGGTSGLVARAATIDATSNTVVFGPFANNQSLFPVTVAAGNGPTSLSSRIVYANNLNKMFVGVAADSSGAFPASSANNRWVPITTSGNTITYGTSPIPMRPVIGDQQTRVFHISIAYSHANNTLIAHQIANSRGGIYLANAISSTVGDANNWIGITHEAITGGNTGRVTLLGGVNESVSGLTPGSNYFVSNTGILTTSATSFGHIGEALSATSIAIGQPASRLATGTANSSTYLRGDNTWALLSSGTSANGASTTVARDTGGSAAFNVVTAASYAGAGVSSSNGASTVVQRDTGGSVSVNTITAASYAGAGVSSSNGASTVVQRDASGDFSANNVTAQRFIGEGTRHFQVVGPNISAGKVASLNANGTITLIGESYATQADGYNVPPSAVSSPQGGRFDGAFGEVIYIPQLQRVVALYQGTSYYPTVAVGVVNTSNNTITFGPATVVNSSVPLNHPRLTMAWAIQPQRLVVGYRSGDDFNYYKVGYIGGPDNTTSVFGTATQISGGIGNPSFYNPLKAIYSNTHNRIISLDAWRIVGGTNTSYLANTNIGFIDATANTITLGTPNTIDIAIVNSSLTLDEASGRVFIFLGKHRTATIEPGRAYGKVGFINAAANTITWGANTTFVDSGSQANFGNQNSNLSSVYNPIEGKIYAFVAADSTGINKIAGRAVTIDANSNTLAFGPFSNGVNNLITGAGAPLGINALYANNLSKVFLAATHSNYTSGIPTSNNAVIAITTSGNTISYDTSIPLLGDLIGAVAISAAYSHANNRIVAFQTANSTLSGGQPALFIANALSTIVGDANNWVGIAHEAITSGNTGRVTILGGVNESVSGLTPGSNYFVSNTGILTTSATTFGHIGEALSATSIAIGQPASRLATGTANSSTYLRGDNTWAIISSGTSANGASTTVARDTGGSAAFNVVTAASYAGAGVSSSNGASTVVQRSASGDFSANNITAQRFIGEGTKHFQLVGPDAVAGKVVSLNANGTITTIGESYATQADIANTLPSASTNIGNFDPFIGNLIYVPQIQRVVIVYPQVTTNYPQVAVGIIHTSNNTITFGTPVVVVSQNAYNKQQVLDWAIQPNRLVVTYSAQNVEDFINSVVGYIGGPDNTTVVFGSATVVGPGTGGIVVHTAYPVITSAYSNTHNRYIVGYTKNVSGAPVANQYSFRVGFINATSNTITYGTSNTEIDASRISEARLAFDESANRLLGVFAVAYDSPTDARRAIGKVGFINATANTTTWGANAIFSDGTTASDTGASQYEWAIVYNSAESKTYVFNTQYTGRGGTAGLVGRAATINATSNTLVWGSFANNQSLFPVRTASGFGPVSLAPLGVYANNLNKIFIGAALDSSGAYPASSANNRWIPITTSGNTITYSSSAIPMRPTIDNLASRPFTLAIAYSHANSELLAYQISNSKGGIYGANAISSLTGNANNWLGITYEAITSGNTGRVTILGGVNESVSGLTPGTSYYVSSTGDITTTAQTTSKLGEALSATSILVGSNDLIPTGLTTGKAIAMAMIFGG